jgi:spore coat polysaccharide biosynthesis protein SpsF (cytidylyltransferase family)
MKITIITQARYGSSRLPGKILKRIGDSTILGIHLKRLKNVSFDHSIIVATTNELESEAIVSIAKNENCLYFKGSTDNVLERFYQASLMTDSSHIVRVTSDCPLIDPVLVSKVIQYAIENDYNYCMTSENFPDGVDVEVFKTEESLKPVSTATAVWLSLRITNLSRSLVSKLAVALVKVMRNHH